MSHSQKSSWLGFARGTLTIIFGVAILFWPQITVELFIVIFAGLMILSGALALASSIISMRHHQPWLSLSLEGIVAIIAGMVVLALPKFATISIVMVLAIWAVVSGLLNVWWAIKLRANLGQAALKAVIGLILLIFGGLLLRDPQAGILASLTIISVTMVIFGLITIAHALLLGKDDSPIPIDANSNSSPEEN